MLTKQLHAKNRLISLDVFRGLTIALMILVNSPGKLVSYSLLDHASWNGCTLADLVFPFFIIIVGMSSVLTLTNSMAKNIATKQLLLKIIKRSIYLFVIGYLLNAFPRHLDFHDVRIMGVLQRIAICYFFSSILFLTTTLRTQMIIAGSLLVGYWLALTYSYPVSSIDTNLAGYVDRLIFAANHLYTPTFDPEGLFSTLPAIATALLGNLAGACLISSRSKKQIVQWFIATGSALVVLGGLWRFTFPLNKSLWSSSYVLWTGGLAFLSYAFCYAAIEIKHWRRWSKPFALFGNNAMSVFILHVVFLKIQAIILIHNAQGQVVNLRVYITDVLFGHLTALNASLCYAVCYTLFWLLVLKCLTTWRSLTFQSKLLPAD